MAATLSPRTPAEKTTAAPVLLALLGNIVITAAKLVAFAFSGSGAMLAEALHSAADSMNSVFLLVGVRLSRRPADARYPYGHGAERYFWSLVSAMSVFLLGGGATIYHGIRELGQPEPIRIDCSPGRCSEARAWRVVDEVAQEVDRLKKRIQDELPGARVIDIEAIEMGLSTGTTRPCALWKSLLSPPRGAALGTLDSGTRHPTSCSRGTAMLKVSQDPTRLGASGAPRAPSRPGLVDRQAKPCPSRSSCRRVVCAAARSIACEASRGGAVQTTAPIVTVTLRPSIVTEARRAWRSFSRVARAAWSPVSRSSTPNSSPPSRATRSMLRSEPLRGEVTGQDYEETLIPAVETALSIHEKIRLLYRLGPDFTGFTAAALWDDTRVGLRHRRDFDRIAVVTDIPWVVQGVRLFGALVPCYAASRVPGGKCHFICTPTNVSRGSEEPPRHRAPRHVFSGASIGRGPSRGRAGAGTRSTARHRGSPPGSSTKGASPKIAAHMAGGLTLP